MRGYDFLDKMSLVDPAYIEAADLKPKKKNILAQMGYSRLPHPCAVHRDGLLPVGKASHTPCVLGNRGHRLWL